MPKLLLATLALPEAYTGALEPTGMMRPLCDCLWAAEMGVQMSSDKERCSTMFSNQLGNHLN